MFSIQHRLESSTIVPVRTCRRTAVGLTLAIGLAGMCAPLPAHASADMEAAPMVAEQIVLPSLNGKHVPRGRTIIEIIAPTTDQELGAIVYGFGDYGREDALRFGGPR